MLPLRLELQHFTRHQKSRIQPVLALDPSGGQHIAVQKGFICKCPAAQLKFPAMNIYTENRYVKPIANTDLCRFVLNCVHATLGSSKQSTATAGAQVVFSTTSWLGGRNDFLGAAYLTVGGAAFVAALGFAAVLARWPRRLGDVRLLSWNKLKLS